MRIEDCSYMELQKFLTNCNQKESDITSVMEFRGLYVTILSICFKHEMDRRWLNNKDKGKRNTSFIDTVVSFFSEKRMRFSYWEWQSKPNWPRSGFCNNLLSQLALLLRISAKDRCRKRGWKPRKGHRWTRNSGKNLFYVLFLERGHAMLWG